MSDINIMRNQKNQVLEAIAGNLDRHELNAARISLSLYRLLSSVFASRPLANLKKNQDALLLRQLVFEHEETEVVHLLIEVAIAIRITHERFVDSFPKMKPNPFEEETVGSLWQPATNANSCPLTLQEACNKIVHAQKITLLANDTRRNPGQSVSSTVYLLGQQRNQRWRAQFVISRFIAKAYAIANITWSI